MRLFFYCFIILVEYRGYLKYNILDFYNMNVNVLVILFIV